MSRILLADSNPILRSALALLLETRLKAQVVAQVNSTESLLEEAAATCPDIVILDCELLGETCAQCITQLRRILPEARIIATSVHFEYGSQAEGADAFVCKFDPPEKILEVVQKGWRGGQSHA
jgi:DNA-binding NarL/FixJ family response regulator